MPLRAPDIQPSDDPAKLLAEKREKAIRDAVSTALLALGSLLAGAGVLRMLGRYDVPGLANVIDSDDVERTLVNGYQPIADLFIEAARQAANDNLGPIVYDPLKASEAQIAIRQGFLEAIRNSQSDVLRLVLLDAVRRGLSPGAAQTSLQQLIGLTGQQAQAVLNYRRMLETGDRSVLVRALRDQRYDDAIREALKGGRQLRPAQIDEMVRRYAQRSLEHRAATFARTESMQAANSGIRDAYVQAVESGQLFDSEVRRFWLCCAGERTCPVCASVPVMNRQGVGVNEPYSTIAGDILAPLAHTLCRCSERYQANLSRITNQPFRMAA